MSCAVLYTVAVPLTSAVYQLDVALAFAIATVQCGSLVLTLVRPRPAAALHLGSVAALVLVTRDSESTVWPLPVTTTVSLCALVLVLGLRQRWIVSVTTWWVSVLLLVALIALSPQRNAFPDQWGTNLTVYAGCSVAVLIVSIALGQRHRIRADLAQARRDVELEQAQRRYVEERARIAREMHDVVAHSMSLVHMQALSAPYRLADATQQEVDREFTTIARSARDALGEMRQLLGALTSGDETELTPQPQVRDIPELAAATSRAGTPVDLRIGAGAEDLSPIVQLTGYRIVQEALSNVVRHAPGARTRVEVVTGGGAVRVGVRNAPPPARHPSHAPGSPDTGGHGLRGMRERVNLLGGRLTTGATDDGGYRVEASFHLDTGPSTPTPHQ
ncbi:sensor histidine kinase [Kineococcus gypseus]|uniref:sensor histidine kinase n=1 Tax=Kineococcus gypseus TaxID=1637102 RepID=UPI003D7DE53B